MKRTLKQIKMESDARVIKLLRLSQKVSRKELAARLDISVSAIEKVERGVENISRERLDKFLNALNITHDRFLKVKRGKSPNSRSYPKKKVLSNKDRRSYKRIITDECKALRSLRRIKKFSQDEASKLCGYSRATIGHIENGRIELDINRIKHIVNSYGSTIEEYQEIIDQEKPRDVILDECVFKLNSLEDEKLNLFIIRELLRFHMFIEIRKLILLFLYNTIEHFINSLIWLLRKFIKLYLFWIVVNLINFY